MFQEGHELSMDSVAAYVGFEHEKTFRLTRAVKNVFPAVHIRLTTPEFSCHDGQCYAPINVMAPGGGDLP